MQQSKKSEIWFPAKTYGWGWGLPCHPMGWLTLLGFFVALSLLALALSRNLIGIVTFFLMVFGLTAGLFYICYLKGEKPKWRWGEKD